MTMVTSGYLTLLKNRIGNGESLKQVALSEYIVQSYDEEGKNLLYYAVASGNIDNIKLLIENGSKLMVTSDTHALFYAVYCDNRACIEYLLDSGLDVNMYDAEGKTMLMCAAYYGRSEICSMLIERGADLFVMDQKCDMAIDYAYRSEAALTRDILNWRMIHQHNNIENN